MEKYLVTVSMGDGIFETYYTLETVSEYGVKSHLYFMAALHESLTNEVKDMIDKNMVLQIGDKVTYSASKIDDRT